mmetsp:Transcript_5736/g.8311  ORF Transcript_5736/g.8311 Transcript_5736/m.8311 type:complete len:232 (-) Transcript_5736:447-1142(-)
MESTLPKKHTMSNVPPADPESTSTRDPTKTAHQSPISKSDPQSREKSRPPHPTEPSWTLVLPPMHSSTYPDSRTISFPMSKMLSKRVIPSASALPVSTSIRDRLPFPCVPKRPKPQPPSHVLPVSVSNVPRDPMVIARHRLPPFNHFLRQDSMTPPLSRVRLSACLTLVPSCDSMPPSLPRVSMVNWTVLCTSRLLPKLGGPPSTLLYPLATKCRSVSSTSMRRVTRFHFP